MTAPFSFLFSQIRAGDIVLVGAIVLLSTALVTLAIRLRLDGPHPHLTRVTQFSAQIGAVLTLEQAYELMRARIPQETALAFINGYRVLDVELRYGFFIEERVERFFLHYQFIMNAVYVVYGVGHVGMTIGVLTLLYLRHRDRYPFVRNLIATTTGITLLVYYLYPTAPPRMFGQWGFKDPLTLHHFAAAGGEQAGSYLYNPYAAMPSLHVGYALCVALALCLAYPSLRVRLLAALYPAIMAAAVIISGNHWILDVVGAVVTVAVAGGLVYTGGVMAGYTRRWAAKLVTDSTPIGLNP